MLDVVTSAPAPQKRAHICILLSRLKGQLKARKNFLVLMDENMEKWRKRSGMEYLRCKSKESDLNMDFKAHLSKLESTQKVCCMVVCLNFDSLELNGRFI